MDVRNSSMSMSEVRNFHKIDRSLYFILAFTLMRDPIESIQVLAFWLLIERLNYRNFVCYMLSLHPSVVSAYADEAMTCLKCIKDLQFVPDGRNTIPMTSDLLKGEISLMYFYHNRAPLAKKLEEIVYGVCAKAIADIVENAMEKHALYNNCGAICEQPQSSRRVGLLKEDKTGFVTFSKGFPISEAEVRNFFANKFGMDYIEAFHMQRVQPDKQALYARIVFAHPCFIDNILNGASAGATKAKFSINGKQFWVRKYLPKNRASLP